MRKGNWEGKVDIKYCRTRTIWKPRITVEENKNKPTCWDWNTCQFLLPLSCWCGSLTQPRLFIIELNTDSCPRIWKCGRIIERTIGELQGRLLPHVYEVSQKICNNVDEQPNDFDFILTFKISHKNLSCEPSNETYIEKNSKT